MGQILLGRHAILRLSRPHHQPDDHDGWLLPPLGRCHLDRRPALRKLETDKVKYVYFVTLMTLAALGLIIIWLTEKPGFVFKLATTGYNFALAFSAWHTLVVNSWLLPKQLRPNIWSRIGLVCGGMLLHFPRHHVGAEARRHW